MLIERHQSFDIAGVGSLQEEPAQVLSPARGSCQCRSLPVRADPPAHATDDLTQGRRSDSSAFARGSLCGTLKAQCRSALHTSVGSAGGPCPGGQSASCLCLLPAGATLCAEHELGAAKQGEHALVAGDFGVPDLGGLSAVSPLGVAEQDAVLDGGEEVGLEFKGGEAGRAVGETGEGAVAAGGVGERDERRGVWVAGGGQQLTADRQPGGD